jgi:hypothetical protein
MKNALRSRGILAAAIATLAVAGSAQAITIYAPDNLGTTNVGSVGDRVIRFDSANPLGTVVTLGSTGVVNRGFGGMDFSGSNVLYAVTSFNQDGSAFAGSQLYSVSTVNGAATLVGNTGLTGANALTDMSWNPVLGQMQAITAAGGLYTLNLTNGAATLVGNITGITGGLDIGLSTNSAGVNHIHDLVSDRMYTVAGLVATPMASTIGIDTNFSQGMTMNWAGANEWFLGSISNNPVFASQVRLMNNATGGTTNIQGTWPNNGVSGLPQYETGDLAIPVPEPTSLALAGLVGLGLAKRRR